MPSNVSIANDALAIIGARSTIASLTEDSTEAKAVNRVFESTRDELLAKAFWNFARATRTLSLLKSAPGTPTYVGTAPAVWDSTLPSPGWLFEYAYPTDCIMCRMMVPMVPNYQPSVPIFPNNVGAYQQMMGPPVPFTPASDTDSNGNDINVLLTNQYQAIAIYTKRITNPALFSAIFAQALSAAIAFRIAMELTGDKGLVKLAASIANDSIMQARVTDGNEGFTVQDTPADWILAREGGVPGIGSIFIAPYGSLYPVF